MDGFAVWLSLALAMAAGTPLQAPAARAEAPAVVEVTGRAQATIDRWASRPELAKRKVGVAVKCTGDGTLWGQRAAATPLYTASVAKLLTTAAAVETWPATKHWTTQVRGVIDDDGRVAGDLALVGHGDPQLMPDHVEALADALVTHGLRRVDGDILVVTGHFDANTLPPAYDMKETDASYRPAISAVGVNYGAVAVSVRPGKRIGDDVIVSVAPRSSAVVTKVLATTAAGKGIGDLQVEGQPMDDGRTRIIVRGQLGQKARLQRVRRRVTDPGVLTGALLGRRLAKRGVRLGGRMRVVAQTEASAAPVLATHESAALGALLKDMNTYSNNAMAETLFKQLGRGAAGPATWQAAQKRVTEALETLGASASEVTIVNGSGLYMATKASPRAVVTVLGRYAGRDDKSRVFRDSLAVSGKSGTLRRRLHGDSLKGRVLAKTGTLDEVVAISGYVPAKSGCLLAFSVLVNDATAETTKRLRKEVDGLIVRLADL